VSPFEAHDALNNIGLYQGLGQSLMRGWQETRAPPLPAHYLLAHAKSRWSRIHREYYRRMAWRANAEGVRPKVWAVPQL